MPLSPTRRPVGRHASRVYSREVVEGLHYVQARVAGNLNAVIVPAANRDRYGPCRLCGAVVERSDTHVPAHAAGNRGGMRSTVMRTSKDGMTTLERDSERPGGMRGWWFCADCNGKTGLWDEEFLDWQGRLLKVMHPDGEAARLPPPGQFTDADPGAFARAVWAWMFALDESETLHKTHAELAAAIRSGDPVEPPSDRRLLLALTTSLEMWLKSPASGTKVVRSSLQGDGWHQSGSVWTPTPELRGVPLAAVSAPPFVAVLTDGDREIPDLFDTGPWLTESARHRRVVPLLLPTVDVRADAVPFITYEDIRLIQS
jgi:hypothetical protein